MQHKSVKNVLLFSMGILSLLQVDGLLMKSERSTGQQARKRSDKDEPCCLNGGLCVLGTFCHCPEDFHGRRCEYSRRPCGPVPHGTWLEDKCSKCRCYDGIFSCLTGVVNSKCSNGTQAIEKISINLHPEETSDEEQDTTDPQVASSNEDKVRTITKLMNQMGLTVNDLPNSSSRWKANMSLLASWLFLSLWALP